MSNALTSLFSSRSFAVVGASKDRSKVGHQIFANLLTNNRLSVIPVNPSATQILGQKAYPSLLEIPQKVDTVVIAVPSHYVTAVIDECILKKVKQVIMITAGFAETSKHGKKLQQEIQQKLSEHEIRLLGPNTLGIISTIHGINASFANKHIPAGSLGLISQSGAMMTAIFTEMSSANVGCSFAISLGNKADISENDALEYAIQDPQTKTIGMYLESFTNLPNFFQLCSKASKKKPVIILKGGRSKRGQSASLSHTAALATNYELLKAAEPQMGFTLVHTVEEFIQTVFFLERIKVTPENVLVITNAGGPGVNTTDVIESTALPLATWSTSSKENIKQQYPLLTVSNPLDVLGDADEQRFSFIIDQAKRDVNIDAMHVIITQQAVTNIPKIVSALKGLKGKKPLLVSLIGGDALSKYRQELRAENITCTQYPNQAINILAIAYKASQAKYIVEQFEQTQTARKQINFVPKKALSYPKITQAFSLLKRYDFLVPKFFLMDESDELSTLPYPLFAKTSSLQLAHKKKLGAVYGIVEDAQQAVSACRKMAQFHAPTLFQKIIQSDLEILLGATRDPQFGMYIACGLGGSFTNILSDRTYLFTPTTKRIIRKNLRSTKAFQALQQLQKEFNWDIIEGLISNIKAIQTLMSDHPEIKELEINPLMLTQHGWWAVDVKIQT